MGKIPKPRKGGSFGGSGHAESKFKSVRRGGRPGASRPKKSGGSLCLVFCLAGCASVALAAGALVAVVQSA